MENKFLQWMSEETSSVYWHDSAVNAELEEAILNGARGVTTNPFLANAALSSDRSFWAPALEKLDKGLAGQEKAEALIGMISGCIADKMKPYYRESPLKGFCCVQVNPTMPGNAEKMLEMAKRLRLIRENIMVKIPATRAGIEAYEECAALGMNVAATVSFTVPQVLAVGEAFKRGAARARANGIEPGTGFAVLMVGRLDDYLRDVAQDTKANVTESDIVQSGTAAIKRAYRLFIERGYECMLMPAGCRGEYHIADLAGAKMAMSIAPKIAGQLARLKGPFSEKIQDEVDPAVIDRLRKMPEFIKAYEPGGMTADEFMTFGSTNRTLTQFVECGWNQLLTFEL